MAYVPTLTSELDKIKIDTMLHKDILKFSQHSINTEILNLYFFPGVAML